MATTDAAMHNRERLGQAPPLSRVKRIRKNSCECCAVQAHEPGWNCYVHTPILDLAHELSNFEATLRTVNM